MASHSSSKGSKSHGPRQKVLGGLKRASRFLSGSPSSRLGGTAATSTIPGSPPSTQADNSSQAAVAQSISGSMPTTDPETEGKGVGKPAWAGLEMALRVLEKSASLFPPLKLVASELNSCLYIVKAAAENQEDYEELASELKGMVETLDQYASELASEDASGSIANFTLSIEREVQRIKEKQNRGKGKRVLEATEDKEDVMRCYRRVEASFRKLQSDLSLRTLRKINKQLELTLLQGMSPEEDARYNSHYSTTIKRRGCTPETRERIRADLQEWVRDPNAAKVYWMNGMAGTGKTTIAYSLCEWLEDNKQLGANFFCSRAKESCRDVSRIIPTIACQLARYSPAFRSSLCEVLKGDQGISKLNVVQQFDKLVRGPLSETKAAIPDGVVIVIDALDECNDTDGVWLVLATLMRFVPTLPIKFFVASRPEPAIYGKMQSSSDYSPAVLRLHDIEESIVEEDIKKYLKEALSPMNIPPSDYQIEQLAKHSGKLFIYAATVARYILPGSISVNSGSRLNTILAAGPQPTNDPRSAKKYRELDRLYTTILAAAFNELLEEEETEAIQLVLWTTVCAQEPLNAKALASLLALTEQQVLSALEPLRSVLHVSEGDGLVSTLHASFPDYMLDKLRSGEFYCDKAKHNHLLVERCVEVMKEQLRFNICNLESSFVFDRDVPDLDERIEQFIPPALSYACRFWGEHMRLSVVSDSLGLQLIEFLSRRLLFWMEVLNLTQCIVLGMPMLVHAEGWLLTQKAPEDYQKLTADALDFVTRFAASACARSTPHIYVSALPFCSKTSSVYVTYWRSTKGLMDIKGTAVERWAQAAMATWATDSAIKAVEFSSNGTRIVSGSDDGTIRVWDARTGEIVAGPFKGNARSVRSVSFSPDNARVVSGSIDDTIHVWDARTGDCVAGPFKGHTLSVNSVAFSPDGARIVSAADDNTIRVWDARTGDTLAGPFRWHASSVNSIALSPDGTRIISGSSDRTIRVWDARTGSVIAGPFVGHKGLVKSVALSVDGTRVVSGSSDRTIRVWDAHTGRVIAGPFRGHRDAVKSVAFSPDGTKVVSASNDCTIRVWDAGTGDIVAGPFEAHTGWVNDVAVSPDGTRIVSVSNDRTIRVWSMRVGANAAGPLKGHTSSVRVVAFCPDMARIVSGSYDRTIRVWDARTGDAISGPFAGHTDCVTSVIFSPNGTRIVSGSNDCTIRVWDARTGETIVGPLKGHTLPVNSVALSPDGACIVSGSDDGAIRMWNAHTGKAIARPFKEYTSSVSSVAFSPDGARIISGSHQHTIHVWDAQTGDLIAGPFEGHTGWVNSVGFSPDGTRIVSGASNWTIRLWDAHTGTAVTSPLQGHTDLVKSVSFSPDGAYIVSGSDDHTIRLWDANSTPAAIRIFRAHTGWVNSVAFSLNSALIVSGSDDRTIRVWDVRNVPFAEVFARKNGLIGANANTDWNIMKDGWVMLNDTPFIWVSPDLHDSLPLPPQLLAIGLQGSIQITDWNLCLGTSWSLCYNSDEA